MVVRHAVLPKAIYLHDAVEAAKIRLSDILQTDVDLPIPDAPDITLSRDEVGSVLSKLLEQCRAPIRIALRHAGIEAHQLDHVVLVGGPTFMPCVRELLRSELVDLGARSDLVTHLERFVTREDFKRNEVSPTECVAQGAALKAARIATPVVTVLPEGYGVIIGGRYFSVIDTKSSYPITGEQSLLYGNPNSKHVSLTVVAKVIDQENSREADVYCFEPVGDFTISLTPDGNLPDINCVLSVSEPKTFSVVLEDRNAGRTVSYDHANATNLKSGRIAAVGSEGEIAPKRRRRVMVTSSVIVIGLLAGAATVGRVIGQNRAESVQLTTDLKHMTDVGERVSKARSAVDSTMDSYVQMYEAIEPDVKEMETTLQRLRTELGLYDTKFPAQHDDTSKSISGMDKGLQRVMLLKQQIEVAKNIDTLQASQKTDAWKRDMLPLLTQEEDLDKTK